MDVCGWNRKNTRQMSNFASTKSHLFYLPCSREFLVCYLQYLMRRSRLNPARRTNAGDVLIHMHVVIRRTETAAKIPHVPADRPRQSPAIRKNNTLWWKDPASSPGCHTKESASDNLTSDDVTPFPENRLSHTSSSILLVFSLPGNTIWC